MEVPQNSDIESQQPRENLIATAVNFLSNPNVKKNHLNLKQQFLRSKGLTEDEIQIACERSGVFTDPTTSSNYKNSSVVNMGGYPSNFVMQPKQTTFGKIKEILNSIALISGLTYAVYLFYKKFIKPFLFGSTKKKSIEEQITDVSKQMDSSISVVKEEVTKIREDLSRYNVNEAFSINREIQNFKTDLDSIKGLLLNRKQFANPNLPIVPPSIPAWQLRSQQVQQSNQDDGDHEHDKNDDAGSGSGSSETEVVTKNSDSSLEIIS